MVHKHLNHGKIGSHSLYLRPVFLASCDTIIYKWIFIATEIISIEIHRDIVGFQLIYSQIYQRFTGAFECDDSPCFQTIIKYRTTKIGIPTMRASDPRKNTCEWSEKVVEAVHDDNIVGNVVEEFDQCLSNSHTFER